MHLLFISLTELSACFSTGIAALLNSTVQLCILTEPSELASSKIMGTNVRAELLQCAHLRISVLLVVCYQRSRGH